MEYKGLVVLWLTLLGLTIPVVTLAQEEPSKYMPEPIVVQGNWAKLKPIVLDFEKAVEMAYAIRNLTYDLFQWEIGYNITAAKVQLEKGDWFLERALNLSETTPKRAAVFAFVAAVHYSHAPALANPVLARVIRENLGENNTITEQTVQAVISIAGELKSILVSAIEKAENYNINTTPAEKLLELGDSRLENATRALEEGNITLAFRYAVSGYRVYVRAYNVLIRVTFTKYIREVEAGFAGTLLEPVEPMAKRLLPYLPLKVQEIVKRKVEVGEVKSLRELSEVVKEHALKIREQIRLMERENLRNMLKQKLKGTDLVFPREVLEKVVDEVVEKAYREGYRGVELARKVIEQLKERIGGKAEDIIRIPGKPSVPSAPRP